MKHIKKLKRLTLCIGLIISGLVLNAQVANKMTYIDQMWGDNGIFSQNREINIDSLVLKNYINQRLGDSIVNWWPQKMIVDTARNFRIIAYEFGLRWTSSEVTDMLKGSYDGEDTLKVAFFNLVHQDYYIYKKKQYELVLRFSHELDAAMSTKVGKICFAKLKYQDKFYYGYLRPEYSSGTNTAYLMRDKLSGFAREVEFNTVAEYTDKLAEHYPKVND